MISKLVKLLNPLQKEPENRNGQYAAKASQNELTPSLRYKKKTEKTLLFLKATFSNIEILFDD